MSCGFSSEKVRKSGSTMQNEGRPAGVGVGEELLDAADVGHVPDHPERVNRRRELEVPLEHVAGLAERPAEGGQMVPGPAATVLHVAAERGLVAAGRPVVDPGDPVPGQHVHDRARPRPVKQVEGQVVHQAVGGPGEQEPAVRERRAQARAEPAVRQRERPGERVVERQILLGPVAHGGGLVALRRGLLGRGHEPVHLAAGPLGVAGAPALAGHAVGLHGGARVIGPDHGARGVRVLGIGRAVVTERESLAPAEGAEVVVERVVLHHQHDDVLDLRQQVGADPAGGIGPVARPVPARLPLPPAQLPAFDPLPGARAGHRQPILRC